MIRLCFFVVLLFSCIYSSSVFAGAIVEEGNEAEALYTANKEKSKILVQKNKEFILRTPDGKEVTKPTSVTVKVGERFYITNEEDAYVHNIYDTTDSSWVLRKQKPSSVAAVVFDKPGAHSLRCAIHPTMKIEVIVI